MVVEADELLLGVNIARARWWQKQGDGFRTNNWEGGKEALVMDVGSFDVELQTSCENDNYDYASWFSDQDLGCIMMLLIVIIIAWMFITWRCPNLLNKNN